MKLTYICECCGAAVEEVELPVPYSGGTPGLTGAEPQDIIKTSRGGTVFLTTLCDDCREMVYGRPESTFFKRPMLH